MYCYKGALTYGAVKLILSPAKLSLLAPTMGKPEGILRMLGSVINQAPSALLRVTELVVFLNAAPEAKIDVAALDHFLQEHRARFHSLKFIKADKYHLTAEESACAALPYATGEYLWVVGDKRIFLPEGLAQLTQFIEAPPTPCAYFNSVWHDRDGHTNAQASTHFLKNITTIPYKDFVQSTGINFMATNMGTWVFQRKFLDPAIWQQIITACGPHFSHVTTLLATMGSTDVTCYANFLTILEAKAYHNGDASEWSHYASLAKTYRHYAWTFGLVRQFQFLIDRGTYTYADVRRSMCSEGTNLSRQIDEIYHPFVSQIWLGWLFEYERMSAKEFDEILSFLTQACPERAIANNMLRKLYEMSLGKYTRTLIRNSQLVRRAIGLDHYELRFSTLIVGQIGDKFVRLHPRGYLLSKVKDNSNFMMAYKLAAPPLHTVHWQIIRESELAALQYESQPRNVDALFPVHVGKPTSFSLRVRHKIRSRIMSFISRVCRSSLGSSLITRFPKPVIVFAWKRWV